MKLREVIDSYTTLKRALGASFKDAKQLLAAFSRAMGEDIDIAVQRDVEFNNGIVRLIRTVPHEVGHQFALLGDDAGNAYGIMSYGNGLQFVPEHLNILRWRVSSPGKP